MKHPEITTTFRAERHPDSTRCRELVIGRHTGGGDCGRACTWTRVWQSLTMSAPAFVPICERCAHRERRAEINRWLYKVGAVIVQVDGETGLRAALEARYAGGYVVQRATKAATTYPQSRNIYVMGAYHAARLARLALGEVKP